MSTPCTRCDNTGFLNLFILDDEDLTRFDNSPDFHDAVLHWMLEHPESDVMVCDCCGDGNSWYGIPGEHYNNEDPVGNLGPYAYNGGLCECH